jgi:hypothetical protein
MSRRISGGIALASIAAVTALAARQQPATSEPLGGSPHRAGLDRCCLTCHNKRVRTADISLEQNDVTRVAAGAEVWEKASAAHPNSSTGPPPPASGSAR